MAFRVGPYEVLGPLASGGMADVFRARHVRQGLPVAIKKLKAKNARSRVFRDLFRAEVLAVAGLDHPGIVLVLDQGFVDEEIAAASGGAWAEGSPYLVTELASGGTLERTPVARSYLELKRTILALLDALAHAHARGVIHRDLKLANVLVASETDARPGLKLTDFGIAHAMDRAGATDPTAPNGTPPYMAPEQLTGDWRSYGPWTDLYALGCMIYLMSSGQFPFRGESFAEIAAGHIYRAPPPLRSHLSVPLGFEEWVLRLLEKAPERRFACAADAASALLALPNLWQAPRKDQIEIDLPSTGSGDQITELQGLAEGSGADWGTTLAVLQPPLPDGAGAPRPTTRRQSWRTERAPARPIALIDAGLGLIGLRPPPFVGRESERDRLWRRLDAVLEHAGEERVLLSGPIGGGKSRLARWIGERAAELGMATFLRLEEGSQGGDPIAQMLLRHLRGFGLRRAELAGRVTAFLHRTGGMDPILADLIVDLLAFEAAPNTVEASKTSFERPAERNAAVRAALARIARERPLVVVVDGLAFDPAVAALLEPSEPALPILWLVTVDDERADRRAITALGERMTEHLRVPPMTDAELRAVLGGLLVLDEALGSAIAERACGRTLFAIRLVEEWIERGVLLAGARGFEVESLAELRIPDGVDELWQSATEELLASTTEPHAELALLVAASLGREVRGSEWLRAATSLGVPERTVRVVGARLIARGLAASTERGLRVSHPWFAESLAGRAERAGDPRAIHLAIVGAISAIEKPRPERDERLGHHLERAGEPLLAIDALLAAGEGHVVRSDFVRADRAARRAEALAGAHALPALDRRFARLVALDLRIALESQAIDVAERAAVALERAATSAGWRAERGLALSARGELAQRRGELASAEPLLVRALEILEADGTRAEIVRTLNRLATVRRLSGETVRARADQLRALELARTLDDPNVEGGAVYGLGILAKLSGDLAAAEAHNREALALFERAGRRVGQANATVGLAEVARSRGALVEAEAGYRRAIELFAAVGSSSHLVPRLNLALLLVQEGRWGEAEAELGRCRVGFERSGRGGLLAATHALELSVAMVAGDRERWDRAFATAQALLDQRPMWDPDLAWSFERAGILAVGRGEHERGRQALARACEQHRRLGDEVSARALERILARSPSVPG